MAWIDIFIRRPVLTWMLTLSLVVFGALGYVRLGVDQYPKMELPMVNVTSVLEGASFPVPARGGAQTESSKELSCAVDDLLRQGSGVILPCGFVTRSAIHVSSRSLMWFPVGDATSRTDSS